MKAKLLNLLKKENKINSGIAGVAALPTLLLIGGIVTVISISLTTSVYLYINSTQGANLSLRALSVAKSGVYDGLMKIVRDKSLVSAEYVFSVGGQSATVVICRDSVDCGGQDKFKITSTGSALTRRKKIVAVVSVDPTTGLTKLESMLEAAL
jgi:hypothetical protein